MRRKSCSRHHFKPTGRGNREKCTDCGALFPCELESCGHSDCTEVRGYPPKCAVCGKDIKPEDWFGLAPPGRSADLGFLPVHRFCVDESEAALIVETSGRSTPTEGLIEGMGVRLSPEIAPVYRAQYGELVDELTVERVVDKDRVVVRWIGMVPVTYLSAKE